MVICSELVSGKNRIGDRRSKGWWFFFVVVDKGQHRRRYDRDIVKRFDTLAVDMRRRPLFIYRVAHCGVIMISDPMTVRLHFLSCDSCLPSSGCRPMVMPNCRGDILTARLQYADN